MKIDELRRLMVEQGLADAWWVNVDGISEPVPVTLLDVEGFVIDDYVGEVQVLNEAHATLDPAPWVAVGMLDKVELQDDALRVEEERRLAIENMQVEEYGEKVGRSYKRTVVMLFGFVCFLGLLINFAIGEGGREKEEKVVDLPAEAEREAKRAVMRNLVAPSTAEFPWNTRCIVKKEGPGDWSVVGLVDAQNAFGAVLRKAWVVELSRDEVGNWSVDRVLLD